MTKLFLTACIFFLWVGFTKAQNDVRKSSGTDFSIGTELSLPVGLFGQVYSHGIGASVQENFVINKQIALIIFAAYINYSLKNTYGGGSNGFIPVLGGLEVSFSPLIFASARVGVTFRTHGLGTTFTYSPGVGFRISKKFTVLLKYVGQTKSAINSSSLGLRFAYVFGK